MQIEKHRVVTLAYTLKDDDDRIIDQSDDGSFCYLHGASNIIPGLENALTGKVAGDELAGLHYSLFRCHALYGDHQRYRPAIFPTCRKSRRQVFPRATADAGGLSGERTQPFQCEPAGGGDQEAAPRREAQADWIVIE